MLPTVLIPKTENCLQSINIVATVSFNYKRFCTYFNRYTLYAVTFENLSMIILCRGLILKDTAVWEDPGEGGGGRSAPANTVAGSLSRM